MFHIIDTTMENDYEIEPAVHECSKRAVNGWMDGYRFIDRESESRNEWKKK